LCADFSNIHVWLPKIPLHLVLAAVDLGALRRVYSLLYLAMRQQESFHWMLAVEVGSCGRLSIGIFNPREEPSLFSRPCEFRSCSDVEHSRSERAGPGQSSRRPAAKSTRWAQRPSGVTFWPRHRWKMRLIS
jgi:hypothetical protein